MKIIQTVLVFCAILALGAPSRAQELPDCIDPQTQMAMSYCAHLDFEKADKELNELWPDVVAAARRSDEYVAEQAKSMGVPTTLEALRAAQRAWISFRDAQCDYEVYEVFGGSAQPMVGSLCLARLTRERIEVLKRAMETR